MGYLRITPPFNNYELAKDYFKLADALKPGSGFINHQLCTVYQKMKDYNNAFKFAKSASDYGIKWAALDEIRLGCIISRNHDVLHSLDRNFDKFSNYGKSILLLQKGSYLLIEKKKISEGLHYCFEGLKLNEHLSFVQVCLTDKCFILQIKTESKMLNGSLSLLFNYAKMKAYVIRRKK